MKSNYHHNLWAIDAKAVQNITKKASEKKAAQPIEAAPAITVQVVGGWAIVPVTGILLKYPGEMCDELCGTSTAELQTIIKSCLDDSAISGITLWIDSPGGQVAGVADLAETIANSTKPIRAVISDSCCSGAYWIASQCDEIYANKSALIGSIGVYEILVDTSKLYNDNGIVFNVVRAGDHKAVGEDGVAITPENLAAEQTVIDDIAGLFIEAIAAGREMKATDAKKLATGEVWIASKAVENGLIDGIGDIEEVLNMPIENTTEQNAKAVTGPVASAEPIKTETVAATEPAKTEPAPEDKPAEPTPVDAINGVSVELKAIEAKCKPAIDACGGIDEPDQTTTDAIKAAVAECDNAIKAVTDLKAALVAVVDDGAEDATEQETEPAKTEPANAEASAEALKAARIDGYAEAQKDELARFNAILKVCGNREPLAIEQFKAGHDTGKALEAYTKLLEAENKNLASGIMSVGNGTNPVAVAPSEKRNGSGNTDAEIAAEWEANVDDCQHKHVKKEYFIAYRKWQIEKSK